VSSVTRAASCFLVPLSRRECANTIAPEVHVRVWLHDLLIGVTHLGGIHRSSRAVFSISIHAFPRDGCTAIRHTVKYTSRPDVAITTPPKALTLHTRAKRKLWNLSKWIRGAGACREQSEEIFPADYIMQLSVMLAPECELIARALAYLGPLTVIFRESLGCLLAPVPVVLHHRHLRCAHAPVELYIVHHTGSLHAVP